MDLSEREYMTRGAQTAEIAAEAPLTVAISDSLEYSLKTAHEIRSRLYALRDRLFGSQPTNGSMSGGKDAPASCFSDHAKGASRSLRNVLDEIDGLSMEIGNRL